MNENELPSLHYSVYDMKSFSQDGHHLFCYLWVSMFTFAD